MRATLEVPVTIRMRFTVEVLNDIRKMTAAGLPPIAIAEKIGTTEASLRMTCSKHKIKLLRQSERTQMLLYLSQETGSSLLAKAREMRITSQELTEKILDYVVKDDLFNAIMDEG